MFALGQKRRLGNVAPMSALPQFAAIRRASSLVSNLAADRRPGEAPYKGSRPPTTDAPSRTLYRCRLQFLCERPHCLFLFCPQGIQRALERHRDPKALLRIVLPFEGHNRPSFENIAI